MDSGLLGRAKRLVSSTPQPQAARVQGRLDMVRFSTLSFELELATGERLRGTVPAELESALQVNANKDVLVRGTVEYRHKQSRDANVAAIIGTWSG